MRGFISSSLKQYATALEFYRRTLDILQWGRRTWKDVPRDDRGTVFDLTFVRGVKRFYMNALLEVSVAIDIVACVYRYPWVI